MVYIADGGNNRIRALGVDGVIRTVAGSGRARTGGDNGPALKADIDAPDDVAVARDGSLYIADGGGVIRRVTPDGIISSVAGNREQWTEYELEKPASGIATAVPIGFPKGLAIGPDDSLYVVTVSSGEPSFLWRIAPDGHAVIIAGSGRSGAGSEAIPRKVQLSYPQRPAFAPDGSLYFADYDGVYRLSPAFEEGVLGEVAVPNEDATELYIFDPAGRHQRTLEPMTGAVVRAFDYDPEGRLSAVRENEEIVLRVERAAGVRTLGLVSAGGRCALEFDDEGYLASLEAAGERHGFIYSSGGLLSSLSTPTDHTKTYHYDTDGRLLREEDNFGRFLALIREVHGSAVEVRAVTNVQESAYSTERVGGGSRTEDRCCGTRRSGEHRSDGSASVTYADGLKLTASTSDDPFFSFYVPRLSRAEFAIGKLVAVVEASRVSKKGAPPKGFTDSVKLNGREYVVDYEAATKAYTWKSPEGRKAEYQNDDRGRLMAVRVPKSDEVRFTYDNRGRLVELSRGAQPFWSVTYDAGGRVASLSHQGGDAVRYEYDQAGRRTRERHPAGAETRTAYGPHGLLSLSPPGRPAHRFSYDAAGRLSEYFPPGSAGAGQPVRYQYDLGGRLVAIEQSQVSSLALSYSESGKLLRLASGEYWSQRDYDAESGLLTTVTTSTGAEIRYAFEGFLHERTSIEGPFRSDVSAEFDANFRRETLVVKGGEPVSFSYDQDGLLTGAGPLAIERNHRGEVTRLTADGASLDYDYDAGGRISKQRARFGSRALMQVEYEWDRSDRLSARSEAIGRAANRASFSYDATGRLTAEEIEGRKIVYGYDLNGNRISRRDREHEVASYYDDQDRLLSAGSSEFAYDGAGRLSSRKAEAGGTSTYRFDPLGALEQVVLSDGRIIDYVNDGYGRRIQKKVEGRATGGLIYHGGDHPVAEVDAQGQLLSTFLYGQGRHVPDAMIRDGTTFLLVTDVVGSVRLVLDAGSGEVVQTITYDGFGRVLADSRPGFQPFGFAGGLYDPDTGLVRFGRREYDPDAGRWTAKDPLLFWGGDTNLYAYAGNAPTFVNDPTGLAHRPGLGGRVRNDSPCPMWVLVGATNEKGDVAKWRILPPGRNSQDEFGWSADIDGVCVPGRGFYEVGELRRLVVGPNGSLSYGIFGGLIPLTPTPGLPSDRGAPSPCPSDPPCP
jgi:RHS repeat-associated protein